MRHLKLTAAAAAAALLLTACPVTALAAEAIQPISAELPDLSEDYVSPVRSYSAVVIETIKDEKGVTTGIRTTDQKTDSEIIFTIHQNTAIVNNETGAADTFDTLTKGDKIYVYASAVMTKSLPPQSAAFVVLTHLGEKAPALYITAGSVVTPKENTVRIVDRDVAYILTVDTSVLVAGYPSGLETSITTITPGTDLLFWTEIMTLSYPAMTGADRVLLLPDMQEKDVVSVTKETVRIGETEVSFAAGESVVPQKDGASLLPLRTVAQALGFDVSWDSESASAVLKKARLHHTFQTGTAGCVLIDGKTYVSTDLLREIARVSTDA